MEVIIIDMSNLIQFIPKELLIVILADYTIGVFFKKLNCIKDKYITIILMLFTIIFSMIISKPSISSFLQGILCWGAAIGINQTTKQLSKEE
jgi:hypothetical protein